MIDHLRSININKSISIELNKTVILPWTRNPSFSKCEESTFSFSFVVHKFTYIRSFLELQFAITIENSFLEVSFISVIVPNQFSLPLEFTSLPHPFIHHFVSRLQHTKTTAYRRNPNFYYFHLRKLIIIIFSDLFHTTFLTFAHHWAWIWAVLFFIIDALQRFFSLAFQFKGETWFRWWLFTWTLIIDTYLGERFPKLGS